MTNCAFNKNGDKFITGSYDQTCIVWDTATGDIVQKLKGHKNVVYSISFNLPYADKVGTGSFDQTAKLWNVSDGKCLTTFHGHTGKLYVYLLIQPLQKWLQAQWIKPQFYGI